MHPLDLVLQLQVGSDQAAVLSLPYVLSSLTPSHFEPSSHLQKWSSRVTSLIHSKHPGARWAGLCLALQTSIMSKDIMMEVSQNWIAVTLPMLSRNETPPTWKACIRLLDFLFTSTIGIPEFQRQLVLPNVPKFSAALLSLAEKSEDYEIRHVSLFTLTHLVPLFPTLHRQLHNPISNLSFRHLSGSASSPTPQEVIDDACRLHAVLHFTGGKVGAAPLWRKSLDTGLANAWTAFISLRTTIPQSSRPMSKVSSTYDFFPSDPAVEIPLSLDRLKCSIALITHLLKAVTSRPVPVPIGELSKLALCLLRCTQDEKEEVHVDSTRRALERSVIPDIWELGCEYVSQLVKSVRHRLNPQLSRIVSCITHHLEQPLSKSHRIRFLRVLPPLLSQNFSLHSPTLPIRLVKTILPNLTALLPHKSEASQQHQEASKTTSKKGKKRARGYEGDEVFKIGVAVICPTSEDCELVETALEALDTLLSSRHLTAPVRTLAGQLLVSLLLEVPRHSPSAISHDLSFHGRVLAKILYLCNKHILAGSSGWINSAVGLIINATSQAVDGSELAMNSVTEIQRELDILLHPRLPPLLRSQPPVEAVALFRSGNAKDDQAAQHAAGLRAIEDVPPATEITEARPAQQTNTQSYVASLQQQSWTTASTTPAQPHASSSALTAPPSMTTSVNAQTSVGVLNKEAPLPSIQNMVNTPQTSSIAGSGGLEIAQQDISLASTSSVTLPIGLSKDQDDESDEEMPEIDTRSDSD